MGDLEETAGRVAEGRACRVIVRDDALSWVLLIALDPGEGPACRAVVVDLARVGEPALVVQAVGRDWGGDYRLARSARGAQVHEPVAVFLSVFGARVAARLAAGPGTDPPVFDAGGLW